MQRQYAAKGLVAVSVSLDNPQDKETMAKVDKFLTKQGANFGNFVLKAKEDEWQEKLHIHGPPCVYVFNRDNRFVLKQADEVDYAVIEKKVQELLEK